MKLWNGDVMRHTIGRNAVCAVVLMCSLMVAAEIGAGAAPETPQTGTLSTEEMGQCVLESLP